MPNPSNTTRRAKAQNIDETRESILAPLPTSTQAPNAHTLNSSLQCACPRCGTTQVIQTAGKPPHYAALKCANCFKFIKWLPKPKSEGAA